MAEKYGATRWQIQKILNKVNGWKWCRKCCLSFVIYTNLLVHTGVMFLYHYWLLLEERSSGYTQSSFRMSKLLTLFNNLQLKTHSQPHFLGWGHYPGLMAIKDSWKVQIGDNGKVLSSHRSSEQLQCSLVVSLQVYELEGSTPLFQKAHSVFV